MGGRLIAFWAACAGSGVTTLVAQVAGALAGWEPPGSVAAVDLNLTEPSLGVLTDVVRQQSGDHRGLDTLLPLLRGRRLTPESLTAHMAVPPGPARFSVLTGPTAALLAVEVREPDIQALLDALLRQYPLVLADLSPTLDSVATWPVLERAHAVVWVAGAHYSGRYHARRYLPVRQQVGLMPERCILVYNLNRPIAPEQMEDELGQKPAVVVPHTPALAGQEERGQITPPGQRYARAVAALAQLIAPGRTETARKEVGTTAER